MGVLVCLLLLAQTIVQAISLALLIRVERWASIICDIKPKPGQEAKVSDPYQKPKEIYSSTPHIIVPKTPTEIQNQNFKKLKDGIEYGDIRRS